MSKSENAKLYTLKKMQTKFKNVKISGSSDAYEFIKNFYGDDLEIFESAFILLMNQANVTIGYAKISQGGIVGTVIDPMIVAKYCVDSLAKNVILCHNHPSGNKKPSNSDLSITNKIKKGLELLDVRLLDHLIIVKDGYTSLNDDGQM